MLKKVFANQNTIFMINTGLNIIYDNHCIETIILTNYIVYWN